MNFSNLIAILFCAFFISCKSSQRTSQVSQIIPSGYEALFNGKDLQGWFSYADDKGTNKELFEVIDGTIHTHPNMDTNSTQSYGALLTEKEYENYVLTLEYKWGTKKYPPRHEFVRDAGIVFHKFGPDVIWPSGAECQLQEGDTGDLWLINVKGSSRVSNVIRNYQEGGPIVTMGNQETKFVRFHRGYCWEVPEWNKVTIEVIGDDAKFYVNGKLVNEAIDMQYYDNVSQSYKPLTKGKILLQAEGAEVYYRNVFIKKL